jgi:hypothetical protein
MYYKTYEHFNLIRSFDIIFCAAVRKYSQKSRIGSDESMVKKEDITCNICGKSFDSKMQMDQYKNDVRNKLKETKVTKKVRSTLLLQLLLD